MKAKSILITSGLILASIFAGAWLYGYWPAGRGNGYGAWQMGYGHMGPGGMGGMMMIFLWGLVLVILILMINWILGQSRNDRIPFGSNDSAQELLKRRYAEGKIDKPEFEEKMSDLREASGR